MPRVMLPSAEAGTTPAITTVSHHRRKKKKKSAKKQQQQSYADCDPLARSLGRRRSPVPIASVRVFHGTIAPNCDDPPLGKGGGEGRNNGVIGGDAPHGGAGLGPPTIAKIATNAAAACAAPPSDPAVRAGEGIDDDDDGSESPPPRARNAVTGEKESTRAEIAEDTQDSARGIREIFKGGEFRPEMSDGGNAISTFSTSNDLPDGGAALSSLTASLRRRTTKNDSKDSSDDSGIAKMHGRGGGGDDNNTGSFRFTSTKRRLTYEPARDEDRPPNASSDAASGEKPRVKKRRSNTAAVEDERGTSESPPAIQRGFSPTREEDREGKEERTAAAAAAASTKVHSVSSRKASDIARETNFLRPKPAAFLSAGGISKERVGVRLSMRELLGLARSRRRTTVQYVAAYHHGDPVVDKNPPPKDDEKHLILDGDLVIQQECAAAKGTTWAAKFGFRHWKLPGLRGEDKRPAFADGEGGAAEESGGAGGQPLFVVDDGLTALDAERVRRFVEDAPSGETPSDFFGESEWRGGSKPRHKKRCDADKEDTFAFDDGVESSEGGKLQKERKVLGDRSNTVGEVKPSNHRSEPAKAPEKKPRTKSARRKRKLTSDPSPDLLPAGDDGPTTEEEGDKRPSIGGAAVRFSVPVLCGEDGGRHFCLIEGMGGGKEEIERGSALPHRGSLRELPGTVTPGNWKALLLNDNASSEYDEAAGGGAPTLRSLRIALRHDGVPSSPLERYRYGEEDAPGGLVVSLVDPSLNRVSSFVKQGVFTKEEEDCCDANEEKATNDSYHLGCVSLATFGGFTSSSESTNHAADVSEAVLARCRGGRPLSSDPPGERRHELLEIFSEEADDVSGILFPCKIGFYCEYGLLVAHDEEFRVAAIDVIFRKPRACRNAGYVALTESLLSEHQFSVGLGAGEMMKRFRDQFKRNYELPDCIFGKRRGDVSSEIGRPHSSELKKMNPMQIIEDQQNFGRAPTKVDDNTSCAEGSNASRHDEDGSNVSKQGEANDEASVYRAEDTELQGSHTFAGKASTAIDNSQQEDNCQSILPHVPAIYNGGINSPGGEDSEWKEAEKYSTDDGCKNVLDRVDDKKSADVDDDALKGGNVSYEASAANDYRQLESKCQSYSGPVAAITQDEVVAATEQCAESMRVKTSQTNEKQNVDVCCKNVLDRVDDKKSADASAANDYRQSESKCPSDSGPVAAITQDEVVAATEQCAESMRVKTSPTNEKQNVVYKGDPSSKGAEHDELQKGNPFPAGSSTASDGTKFCQLNSTLVPANKGGNKSIGSNAGSEAELEGVNGMQENEEYSGMQGCHSCPANNSTASNESFDNGLFVASSCDPFGDCARHEESIDKCQAKAQKEPTAENAKKEDDHLLTAAYEDLKKSRKASQVLSKADSMKDGKTRRRGRWISKNRGGSSAAAKNDFSRIQSDHREKTTAAPSLARVSSHKTSITRSTDFLRSNPCAAATPRIEASKLSQRELLSLAKKRGTTAVQYVAVYHDGDSILDKNFAKSVQHLIENGNLIIRKEYANAKGTAWTDKLGFRHWRLPGQRSLQKRPVLADSDVGVGKKSLRPLLTVDTSVTARDSMMVRKFVIEAHAGQTPLDFYSESELTGRQELRRKEQHSDTHTEDSACFNEKICEYEASPLVYRSKYAQHGGRSCADSVSPRQSTTHSSRKQNMAMRKNRHAAPSTLEAKESEGGMRSNYPPSPDIKLRSTADGGIVLQAPKNDPLSRVKRSGISYNHSARKSKIVQSKKRKRDSTNTSPSRKKLRNAVVRNIYWDQILLKSAEPQRSVESKNHPSSLRISITKENCSHEKNADAKPSKSHQSPASRPPKLPQKVSGGLGVEPQNSLSITQIHRENSGGDQNSIQIVGAEVTHHMLDNSARVVEPCTLDIANKKGNNGAGPQRDLGSKETCNKQNNYGDNSERDVVPRSNPTSVTKRENSSVISSRNAVPRTFKGTSEDEMNNQFDIIEDAVDIFDPSYYFGSQDDFQKESESTASNNESVAHTLHEDKKINEGSSQQPMTLFETTKEKNQESKEETSDDDQSFYSTASCPFGGHTDDRGGNDQKGPGNESTAQPLHYQELNHMSPLQTTPPLESLTEKYFHDCYDGQKSEIVTDTDDDSVSSLAQPLHAVYFGLDDDDSSIQTQGAMGLLIDAPAEDSLPFHDYYFGKESYCVDAQDNVNKCEKAAKRISRCAIQTRPLLMITLFVGMLVRTVQAFGCS